jgi:hypothetical protein
MYSWAEILRLDYRWCPLGEGRHDRVGIVTIPGVEIALCNLDGIHGIDSDYVKKEARHALTRERYVRTDLQPKRRRTGYRQRWRSR